MRITHSAIGVAGVVIAVSDAQTTWRETFRAPTAIM